MTHKIGVFLVGRADNGGSYQYWRSMLKGLSLLDKGKYDVKVYAQNREWLNVVQKLNLKFEQDDSRLNYLQRGCNYVLPRILPLWILKRISVFWNPFYRKIKKEHFELWISQSVSGVGEQLGIPSMIPIFDLMHRYEREFEEVNQKYKEREWLYKNECKKATILLADSTIGKQHIIESYGDVSCRKKKLEQKIKILPFIPPDYIYDEIPKKPEVEIFDKYLFYPAQFWTHKNHKNLLQAIKALKEKDIIINLILVGSEQNNKNNVEIMIKDMELQSQVKILGYVTNNEMIYLYQHATALIMPTFFGPTNIPQLEAFVLGCPVLTSGIYGIPEQVGNAALLFNPNQQQEIAVCIERIWSDASLREELICKGKENASKWGFEQFAQRLSQYIEEYFKIRGQS